MALWAIVQRGCVTPFLLARSQRYQLVALGLVQVLLALAATTAALAVAARVAGLVVTLVYCLQCLRFALPAKDEPLPTLAGRALLLGLASVALTFATLLVMQVPLLVTGFFAELTSPSFAINLAKWLAYALLGPFYPVLPLVAINGVAGLRQGVKVGRQHWLALGLLVFMEKMLGELFMAALGYLPLGEDLAVLDMVLQLILLALWMFVLAEAVKTWHRPAHHFTLEV